MRRYNILIVDDHEVSVLFLQSLLQTRIKSINTVFVITSYRDAVTFLESDEFQIDASILDNKLDERKTAFDLIRLFGRKKFGDVLVYTSDERKITIPDTKLMMPDLELYKPYDIRDELDNFVVKLKSELAKGGSTANAQTAITIFEKGAYSKVPYSSIFYFESNSNTTDFYCYDTTDVFVSVASEANPLKAIITSADSIRFKKHTLGESIGYHEEYLLKSNLFVKCSKSIVLNRQLMEKGLLDKESRMIYFDKTRRDELCVQYPKEFRSWLEANGW